MATAPDASQPLPDFDGRFREVERVAERTLAATFRARDPLSGRRVFLKLMREETAGDPEMRELFAREPALLEELARRAPEVPIVPVIGSGEWRGLPYFVQPLLVGWSLDRAMRDRPRFDGRSALAVIEGCLAVLELLHAAGVVHGDLSPDNLFLETAEPVTADGRLPAEFRLRIVDFNAARRLDGPENCNPRRIVLKPSYAPPELAQGLRLSPRSDLHSLGVTFFELLTGDRPYAVASVSEVTNLPSDAIPAAHLLSPLPELVREVVLSMIAVDERRRPESAAQCREFLHALREMGEWLAAAPTPRATSEALRTASTSEVTEVVPLPAARQRTAAGVSTPASPPVPALGSEAVATERPITAVAEVRRPRREETTTAVSVPVQRSAESIDLVDFSVFAPESALPGTSFLLEVWAYLGQQRDEMLEQANRQGRLMQRGSRNAVRVPSAAELTLVLRLDDFEVDEPQDTFCWCGEIVNSAFIVRVPRDMPPGIRPGRINVLHGGLLLTRLLFEVTVGSVAAEPAPLAVDRQQVRAAFASYASADREEVLRRVQGMSAAGVDVFVDVLSLRAGDSWEPLLLENIRRRDVFFLFWSDAARQSVWVEREWRLALSERGLDYIHPVPLADPRDVPPPAELASRHFNDLILAVLNSQAMSRPA